MKLKFTIAILCSVWLAGCAGPSPYITPVESRTVTPVAPPPSGTIVPVDSTNNGVSVNPANEVPRFRTNQGDNSVGSQTGFSNSSVPTNSMPAVNQNSSSAVVALLGDARQTADRGDLSSAESQVERALRIAPRDPQVYLQLASLKRQQGEYLQAEQVALRGLAVSEALPDYKALLWKELAKIRRAAGDTKGAGIAEAEAARY